MENLCKSLESASLSYHVICGVETWCRPAPQAHDDPYHLNKLDKWFNELGADEQRRHLERGCLLCGIVSDRTMHGEHPWGFRDECVCRRVRVRPPDPPPCPEAECSAATPSYRSRRCSVRDDPFLGKVQWCSHQESFHEHFRSGWRCAEQLCPWPGFQRRWLASDGTATARDALLAEWSSLNFDVRHGEHAQPDELRWTLYREPTAVAAQAEQTELEHHAWMIEEHARRATRYVDGDYGARRNFNAWKERIAIIPHYDGTGCPLLPSGRRYTDDELRRTPADEQERTTELARLFDLALAAALAVEMRWGEERAARAGVPQSLAQVRVASYDHAAILQEMAAVAREAGKLRAWGLESIGGMDMDAAVGECGERLGECGICV